MNIFISLHFCHEDNIPDPLFFGKKVMILNMHCSAIMLENFKPMEKIKRNIAMNTNICFT